MSHILSAGLRRLLLAALAVCLPASGALALSLSTVSRPDTDSLLLQFAKPGAYPLISRTGPAEISLTFPPGVLSPEDKPEGVDFGASQFIEGVRLSGDTLAVRLKTDAFGFVGWPQGESELKLQVYRDPAGANWRPPAGNQEPQTTSPPRDGAAPPKAASSLTLPVTPPNNKPGPLELPPLPASLGQGGGPAPAAPSGAASGGEAAKEPFYAVPYSLRATAMQVPAEKAPTLRPSGMEPPAAPPAAKTPSLADGASPPPAQGGGGAG